MDTDIQHRRSPREAGDYLMVHRKSIAWGSVFAGLALLFPANRAYVQWHEDQARAIVRQELQGIQQSLTETQRTANEGVEKLDFLIKAEAARTVDNLRLQLSLMKNQEPPVSQAELARLERRAEAAEAYRNCVMDDKKDCDALRVY